MKAIIVFLTLTMTSTALANERQYSCKVPYKTEQGYTGYNFVMLSANDPINAAQKAKDYLKVDASEISCSVPPRVGALNDLAGKKWAFQGLNANATYLVFEGKQLLHVQECGSKTMIHKFDVEVIAENSLKLIKAGTSGECNPFYYPGFETGSVVTAQIMIHEDRPATLLLSDRRPSEKMESTSLYYETK